MKKSVFEGRVGFVFLGDILIQLGQVDKLAHNCFIVASVRKKIRHEFVHRVKIPQEIGILAIPSAAFAFGFHKVEFPPAQRDG